jgi:nucleoid DNA-binding protein
MALTKHDIVEQVYNEIGFSKNQSVETVEALLELIKAAWNPAKMSWSVGSENFVSRKKMNGKAGIRPPVRMPSFRQEGW